MSFWEDNNIGDRINQILLDIEDEGHHFGRPFLTAYQLAIEFASRYPDIVARLGKQVGGAGTGEHTSIAQYLALELSRQIRDNPDYPVEGAFISNRYVRELSYEHNNETITSSLTGTRYSLSMFRLHEQR
jgi:hypothetical protein